MWYEEGMKVVSENRQARRYYELEKGIEAGICLTGTEVKSLRVGQANLKEGYAALQGEEIYLHGVHIAPHAQGNRYNHDPLRSRKLLLKKEEILKLKSKMEERGFSLIPLKLYFNDRGKAKVLIALGKGKKKYDKRDVIERESARKEMRHAKHSRNKK